MKSIFSLGQINNTFSKLRQKGGTMVLVGGCFDILHPGHVTFLQKAKLQGDHLVVLLESDEKITRTKGLNRPIHTQKERSKVLSALQAVDYIITLPFMEQDEDYDKIVKKLQPDVIATTHGDPDIGHKERSAKLVGAKVVCVTKIIAPHSTTRLAEALSQEM